MSILGLVTFLYRSKTVDLFIDLSMTRCAIVYILFVEQKILSIDSKLEAPPMRSINDFLSSASCYTMTPHASSDEIDEYCRLYLWARHDLNVSSF